MPRKAQPPPPTTSEPEVTGPSLSAEDIAAVKALVTLLAKSNIAEPSVQRPTLPTTPPPQPVSRNHIRLQFTSSWDGSAHTLVAWLSDFDSYISVLESRGESVSDVEKIHLATSLLTGQARTWCHPFGSLRSFSSWEQFKTDVKAHFLSVSHRKDMFLKLSKVHQRGSMTEYINYFNSLHVQTEVDEEQAVLFFINGISHLDIRRTLSRPYPTTLVEAFAVARREELLYRVDRRRPDSKETSVPHRDASDQQAQDTRKQIPGKRACFRCGDPNHKVRDCPQAPPQANCHS
jgi:hypothetical protein